MDNSILEMIDQIDQESFIAEMDVMVSLSEAYTKEIILEASTDKDENKPFTKRLIETAKKVLQKVKEFFQIIINQIRKAVLKKRYNKILDKAKKDHMQRIFKPIGYDIIMRDIKNLTNEVSGLIKQNFEGENPSIEFKPEEFLRLARIFKKNANDIEQSHIAGKRKLSTFNKIFHAYESDKEFRKNYLTLIDYKRDMISITELEEYIKTSTAFCDAVLSLSSKMFLCINTMIDGIKERNEKIEKGMVDIPGLKENQKMLSFVIQNPDKLSSFTSDLLKCVSSFMKLELDNIDTLWFIVEDSERRKSAENVYNFRSGVLGIIEKVGNLYKSGSTDDRKEKLRKQLKEQYPDLTDHDIDEMLRDQDDNDLFGGDDDK